MINEAIKKACNYNETLNQREYDELLKAAKISGFQGREACDAIATALANGGRAFRYVRRNEYDEKKYGALGHPRTSSGCFVTTACMQTLEERFDDNCRELTILRELRDYFVAKNYPADVKEYYIKAPNIVNELNNQANKQSIYQKIYQEMIIPCVTLCENSRFEEAYNLYKDCYYQLEKDFL